MSNQFVSRIENEAKTLREKAKGSDFTTPNGIRLNAKADAFATSAFLFQSQLSDRKPEEFSKNLIKVNAVLDTWIQSNHSDGELGLENASKKGNLEGFTLAKTLLIQEATQ